MKQWSYKKLLIILTVRGLLINVQMICNCMFLLTGTINRQFKAQVSYISYKLNIRRDIFKLLVHWSIVPTEELTLWWHLPLTFFVFDILPAILPDHFHLNMGAVSVGNLHAQYAHMHAFVHAHICIYVSHKNKFHSTVRWIWTHTSYTNICMPMKLHIYIGTCLFMHVCEIHTYIHTYICRMRLLYYL